MRIRAIGGVRAVFVQGHSGGKHFFYGMEVKRFPETNKFFLPYSIQPPYYIASAVQCSIYANIIET